MVDPSRDEGPSGAAHRPSRPSGDGQRPDRTTTPAAPGESPSIPTNDDQLSWLIAEHGPTLYKVAFAVTRDHALAEEVVQDALFQAWSSMPSWEGDVPIKWMRRVVRNRAVSVMRKESRSTATDTFDRQTANGIDTARIVEGRHEAEAMLSALASLDEESRTMLVLRETDELSYHDLGELLDLSPTAVKSKLYRARHDLKSRLRAWEG